MSKMYYELKLPSDLYGELQERANLEKITVLELIKRCIKIGLLASYLKDKPNARLFVEDQDGQRELTF